MHTNVYTYTHKQVSNIRFFGRHTQTIIAPSVISTMLSPQQEINYAAK